jgi:SAM-dependent methyltransferase
MIENAIARSHRRFAEGRDYHRQFLDRYLPTGLIGDIGCGDARIAAFYEGPERRFISIDSDVRMVRMLQSLPLDVRVGDAFSLPVEDGALDAYIGLGIFELGGDRGSRGMAEAARVVKPGGVLYVTVPFLNVFRRRGRDATWRGIKLPAFSSAEMSALLDRHGFDTILSRPSSIAHGLGPLRRLASLFRRTLNDETGILYDLAGPLLRPFANSLLVIGRKRVN